MRCEGARCSSKKRELGPVVWLVDQKPLCATCFEGWIEQAETVFDQHHIVRSDAASDKSFDLHKGKTHRRAEPVPA
jgi:hypothetical protein